jgi:hypothetical protein
MIVVGVAKDTSWNNCTLFLTLGIKLLAMFPAHMLPNAGCKAATSIGPSLPYSVISPVSVVSAYWGTGRIRILYEPLTSIGCTLSVDLEGAETHESSLMLDTVHQMTRDLSESLRQVDSVSCKLQHDTSSHLLRNEGLNGLHH